MAFYKIDLPGLAQYHKGYHLSRGTQCNHDCMFYEELGEEIIKHQRLIIEAVIIAYRRVMDQVERPLDPRMIEGLRLRVFGDVTE